MRSDQIISALDRIADGIQGDKNYRDKIHSLQIENANFKSRIESIEESIRESRKFRGDVYDWQSSVNTKIEVMIQKQNSIFEKIEGLVTSNQGWFHRFMNGGVNLIGYFITVLVTWLLAGRFK